MKIPENNPQKSEKEARPNSKHVTYQEREGKHELGKAEMSDL